MPNKFGSVCLAIFAISLLAQCKQTKTLHPSVSLEHLQSFPIAVKRPKGYEKGKRFPLHTWDDIYEKIAIKDLSFPDIDAKLSIALQNQLKLLKRRKLKKEYQIGDLKVQLEALKATLEGLVYTRNQSPNFLEELDTYQIKGKDGKGNVYFTGYYTPVIKVDYQPSSNFLYPIYAKPNKKEWNGYLPSRAQIDGDGALLGKGLELAYARSLVDIYYMQLQGSGIIEYPDGKREYLSYTSTNGHSYRSIEKQLVKQKTHKVTDVSVEGVKRFFKKNPEMEESILFTNPSYVFFDRKRDQPHGAGHVPLTADISIAVDDLYIPLGGVLLAAIPILDNKGNCTHHDYRILLAQDLGGAIRGSGHIDLYCGIGTKGRKKAMAMHHYGQLWLLLPKGEVQTKGRLSSLN